MWCSPPNLKLSIRDLSQISTTALIFMKTNYFRQDVKIKIWIQFHFQYIFEGRDDFIHTRHIIVPPQIDSCKLDPSWWPVKDKHVGTSWTLFCKRKLRYLGSNNLEDKYFHISNCIFTIKGWSVKKIILRCFLHWWIWRQIVRIYPPKNLGKGHPPPFSVRARILEAPVIESPP